MADRPDPRARGQAPILPAGITACLFDLDGVLTDTAQAHAAAWRRTFDSFLAERAARTGEAFQPFDPDDDYIRYVDGRLRADGVRTFLASRGIVLEEGSPDDEPTAETVQGLASRKNHLVLEVLAQEGVHRYEGSVRFLTAATAAGLRRAVVSASQNARQVLEVAGLADMIEARVDGVVAAQEHLHGKPAPDMFLAAAEALGVEPAAAVVFEDAVAGVAAGRAGGFGWVVGVDRTGSADQLRTAGAHIVVDDLAELLGPA